MVSDMKNISQIKSKRMVLLLISLYLLIISISGISLYEDLCYSDMCNNSDHNQREVCCTITVDKICTVDEQSGNYFITQNYNRCECENDLIFNCGLDELEQTDSIISIKQQNKLLKDTILSLEEVTFENITTNTAFLTNLPLTETSQYSRRSVILLV